MKIHSTALITYLLMQLTSVSFSQERISREPSKNNEITLEQLESLFKDAPVKSRPEFHQNDEDAIKGVAHSRKFAITPYEKIKDLFDETLLVDAIDNCPSQLKKNIDDITYFIDNKPNTTDVYKDLVNRLILVGPSGSGKTTLCYAIAHHCKMPFSFVKASALSNETRVLLLLLLITFLMIILRKMNGGLSLSMKQQLLPRK